MNILMIMTDQQHKYALGSLTPYVKTPNLDRLAKDGTLFCNAYSNNPVCTPFRGILYSGMYSRDNHVILNNDALHPDEITLPLELERAGYETSFVGKLHLGATGNCPVPSEFRAGHKHFLGYQCYNDFLDNICFYDENNQEHCYTGHRTEITTELGIERLRMLANTGKPFLHTIFYQAPHYPEQPLPCYEAVYKDTVFPMPEAYEAVEPYTATCSPRSSMPVETCENYQRYGGNIQEYLKLYFAMVTQIDDNIGRILRELEILGIAEDTAILFSSDHGDMQGSHGMKNKCLPFERSCGIPLIINIPNTRQVPIVSKPVSAVDYYPTCMALAGVASKKALRGQELLSLALGTEKVEHPPVFAENRIKELKWIMYRDDTYKLVVNEETEKAIYLFDMINDPTECDNLVDVVSFAEIRQDLMKKLLAIKNS